MLLFQFVCVFELRPDSGWHTLDGVRGRQTLRQSLRQESSAGVFGKGDAALSPPRNCINKRGDRAGRGITIKKTKRNLHLLPSERRQFRTRSSASSCSICRAKKRAHYEPLSLDCGAWNEWPCRGSWLGKFRAFESFLDLTDLYEAGSFSFESFPLELSWKPLNLLLLLLDDKTKATYAPFLKPMRVPHFEALAQSLASTDLGNLMLKLNAQINKSSSI